jgi:hypothetical protein
MVTGAISFCVPLGHKRMLYDGFGGFVIATYCHREEYTWWQWFLRSIDNDVFRVALGVAKSILSRSFLDFINER